MKKTEAGRDWRMICKLPILDLVHLLTPLSFIGACFGELATKLQARADFDSVSPFVFLQAYGAIFKDDDSRPLNGGSSQETSQFINELLITQPCR